MSLALPASCDRAVQRGAGHKPAGHPALILTTCILASSLAFIDGSVLNVALPAIREAFRAGTAEAQWVVNAFTLPLSALLLLGGALGDLYGRRRVMIAGIVLFTLASLLCAAAPSLPVFLAGRALQGLGAALLLPNSLAILSASFAGEKRGQAVGIWAAAGAGAGAFAPMLGGWLIESVGWQAIFLLNAPVAAAAVALGWRFVPESHNEARPDPDWPGAALATLGLGALTWGLTIWSAGRGMRPLDWTAFGLGLALLLAFLLAERRRGDRAMVPLAMFGSRAFVGLTVFTFLLYGALGGLMLLLPYVLIEAGGYSPTLAGAALLPLPIVIAVGSPLMGRVAAKVGPRWPLTIGPAIVAGGFALMGLIETGGSYWTDVLPALLAISGGMTIAVAPLTTAVLSAVKESHVGTASGLNSAVSRTGGLIAVALAGGVLSRSGAALIGGFHGAALVGVGLALAAALIAFATLKHLHVEE